jgi:hypothetical protein
MTSADRFDLFTGVHKGLRAALFETHALLARTDFGAIEDATLAARGVDRLLAFLEEHAAHEDAVVLPAVEALSPELFVALREDHARIDGLQRDLAALAARLAGAGQAERAALGRRLHDRLGLLLAEHLRHMAREEQDVQRLLWAHHDDAALRAIHGRILGRIPPARSADWIGLILPALSAPERSALLGALVGRPS